MQFRSILVRTNQPYQFFSFSSYYINYVVLQGFFIVDFFSPKNFDIYTYFFIIRNSFIRNLLVGHQNFKKLILVTPLHVRNHFFFCFWTKNTFECRVVQYLPLLCVSIIRRHRRLHQLIRC